MFCSLDVNTSHIGVLFGVFGNREDYVHIFSNSEIETVVSINATLPHVLRCVVFFCVYGRVPEIFHQEIDLLHYKYLQGG